MGDQAMKIQGEAETSARTGVPTYSVREEDRAVSWTVNLHTLIRLAEWDNRPSSDRALMIHNWRSGDPTSGIPVWAIVPDDQPRPVADLSMLEQHAIVARNALR